MAVPANRGVRAARLALADMRAMEEEGERMNPVNPHSELEGGAALPSMGLSQFHGGKKGKAKHTLMDHIKHPMKGFGKEAESESDDEESMEAGRMLRSHIEELHGGAYLRSFMKGMGGAMGLSSGGLRSGGLRSGGVNTGRYEGEGMMSGGSSHMVGGASFNVSGPGYEAASGGAAPAKGIVGAGDPRRKRGALVSKLMKEKGMSLGEASKYIKAHPELLK